MKLSIISALLALAAQQVYADAQLVKDKDDDEERKFSDVIYREGYVDYSITTFTEEDCQGESVIFMNFTCSMECYPGPPSRSILIQTNAYNESVWYEGKEDNVPDDDGPWLAKNLYDITNEGPVAMVYGGDECRYSTSKGRAHVKKGDYAACITFPEKLLGFQPLMLRRCGWAEHKQLINIAQVRERDIEEEEWFFPKGDNLGHALGWKKYDGKSIANLTGSAP